MSINLSLKIRLVWAFFLASLLLTLFASLHVKQRIEDDAVKQVSFAYDEATLKIEERLNTYAQILRGGAGLFAASDTVTRSEWAAYVEKLHPDESVPGVQGIGFAQLIPPGQFDNHIKRIRREGFPNYSVRPPGERAITTSIIYLEPFRDRNLRAFGFDMFSEPIRRAAMEQARDSGNVALSGKVVLVQETAKDVQAGTLMYVPVYRNGAALKTTEQKQAALIGWTYSPYRMNDLMTGILRQWESEDGQAIDLHIHDGTEATTASLLYDSKPDNIPNASALFVQQRRISFNGRQWLLVFDYKVTAVSLNYTSAWLSLIGGLIVSGLLLSLMLSTINIQSKATQIADGLVAKLVEHETALEKKTEELTRINTELTRLGEVMAHHFQEPTRRMKSFAQRLLRRSELVNDADSRQSLEFIDQQSQRLSELVKDAQRYLALSHTAFGADGTANSSKLLHQWIAKSEAGLLAAVEADIFFQDTLPTVRIAEKSLRELFDILFDNALRYRRPERKLRIEVSASMTQSRAVFRFADNGSGIAPEYREQVLGIFTRLVPNSIPGTGMGLALVRKIVQQTGGKVVIEDGLEGGTCIVFDLPLELSV